MEKYLEKYFKNFSKYFLSFGLKQFRMQEKFETHLKNYC